MSTCAFITLGCKVNQYDTQAMRESLRARGYREVGPRSAADLYIVNTCTVTGIADSKCARAIRRLLREHPESRVVVAGCGVDAAAGYLDEFGGRVVFARNEEKLSLPDLLAGGAAAPCESWASGVGGFSGHTRAFVKIQDGCDASCTYCIVPDVRGPSRLRPADEAVDEIRRLANAGFREIVLTGIHLGRHTQLVRILREAAGVEGIDRLRLSSIEAGEVTDELLDAIAACPAICPHLHLPVQSGSDRVLRRMNRPYGAGQFLSTVERIRRKLDVPALTTDVIVGFPGETDEDFRATIDLCRRAAFSRLHVFRYSDRPGTPASAMPKKCGSHIVIPRMHQMKQLAAELAEAFHRQWIGREVDVLVEHRRDRRTGRLDGLTERYVRVLFDGPSELMGRLALLRVTEAGPEHAAGELAETGS